MSAIALEIRETVSPWQLMSWQEYVDLCQEVSDRRVKAAYFLGRGQLGMGVGAEHGSLNAVIELLLNLYCLTKGISLRGFVNTSYRQAGLRECQPDLSYYVGDAADVAPSGGIVNLEMFAAPSLAIEIADSSLMDDLGMKRMLYEAVRVQEYWVVDVRNRVVFGFGMLGDQGSGNIAVSQVLAGLVLSDLEAGLRQSEILNNTRLGQWWLEQLRRA